MREPTALLADDEEVLRAELTRRLAECWPELRVVGQAENGEEALRLIRERAPDVAFLDIRMPGLDGLQVAARVAGLCRVVFVTAYDRYAVDAFEHQALDYLLKPLSEERLRRTVGRLKAELTLRREPAAEVAALVRQVTETLAGAPAPRSYLRWIRASHRGGVRLLPVEEVVYFRASDKYTTVATAEGELLIKKPVKELAEELDPERFWPIHRGTLVNLSFVAGLVRDLAGRSFVRLKGTNETLPVSRSELHRFQQM